MPTWPWPNKTAFATVQCIFGLLVLAVQGLAQTPRSLREELKHLATEKEMSVAMFDHGKLSTAPIGSPKSDWNDVQIAGAMGHSWSYEGMLSPDGTLAAFPYWEVDPCPSWKNCDVEADRHYFLAVAHTDGSGVRKYPRIVLPSEMCWTRDNSKLALVAHLENDSRPQLLVLDLNSGMADSLADGKNVAVTPQCWSPEGKQLAYFAGEKDYDRPGAIRIWDTATRE